MLFEIDLYYSIRGKIAPEIIVSNNFLRNLKIIINYSKKSSVSRSPPIKFVAEISSSNIKIEMLKK